MSFHPVKYGLASVGVLALLTWTLPRTEVPLANIAFIGNSIMFVNDLPRFFEALSGDHIYQNSCLHGSLSLMSILVKGNGMYKKFSSENALISDRNYSDIIYDFGACSVPQLLFGWDDNLSQENENGVYVNDGKNPCFVDANYFQYLSDTYHPPQWDYVVMNDQTIYPGEYTLRQKSLLVLKQVYTHIILETKSRPVFLMTHAYVKSKAALNESHYNVQLGDIPEFTSRVYYGYRMYAQTLGATLPEEQEPLLAPSGLAFLTLWEENYGLWEKLFAKDGFHPSPHGSYLIGCVLYATIFGRMPPTAFALQRDMEQLWSRARKMQLYSDDDEVPLPTLDEANYLYSIAERVVLQQYRPQTLLPDEEIVALDEAEYGSGVYDYYDDFFD